SREPLPGVASPGCRRAAGGGRALTAAGRHICRARFVDPPGRVPSLAQGAGCPLYGAAPMPGLKVGSEGHKLLFCREFTRTLHPYEVRDVQWPHLDEANLERLRALPFWSEAVCSE